MSLGVAWILVIAAGLLEIVFAVGLKYSHGLESPWIAVGTGAALAGSLAMLSMGLASFCNDLTMPGSWATCMDIGGKYAGTVSGSMNMMGNFGGMAGPLVVGFVLSTTNRDWQLAFLISSVIYVLGAVFWLFIDPVTPLSKTSETTHA